MGGMAFRPYTLDQGLLEDLSGNRFPARITGWRGESMELPQSGTAFCFLFAGNASLECASGAFLLRAGMYASIPGPGRLSGTGQALLITQFSHRGFFHLGGPIEETGRLRYIDGCTDSLLIPPVRWGDPCLNLLHIPPHTKQTQHTHPSFRAGVIVSGRGKCITPDGDHPLEPGLAFVIPEEGLHSFHTQDEALRVIAFHPDSDFGPTDETHPMINRTIIPTSSP